MYLQEGEPQPKGSPLRNTRARKINRARHRPERRAPMRLRRQPEPAPPAHGWLDHYQVTIKPTVRGRRGFGLAAEAHWGATFRPMTSAVYFPGARVSQRAALGLRFTFLQVHTGALRWRLAAVPLEKLPAAEKRVREFTSIKTD